MKFPDYFADADSDYRQSEYVIFGIPYDKTSSFRPGARYGPKSIRQSSWNFESFNFFSGIDLKDIKFHDYGDLEVKKVTPKMMVKTVKDFSTKLLSDNKFPIALGGEHSITSGIIQSYPKDVAVLVLDAHLDFRDKYENESFNHACVIRRIADHIPIENIAVMGIRSAEKEEYQLAKEKKLFFIDAQDIRQNGIKKAISKVQQYLGDKPVYLSFDIDVLDPAYAPGTSTPEPFGLTPWDILKCIQSFSSKLVGFDIVEVCPSYDDGETALLAAKYVSLVIQHLYSNKIKD